MNTQYRTKLDGTLRVWHIPQVPMNPFYVTVETLEQAVMILKALADYDLFQAENNVKSDYCNAQGLEFQDEDGDWSEWTDEFGDDINSYMRLIR